MVREEFRDTWNPWYLVCARIVHNHVTDLMAESTYPWRFVSFVGLALLAGFPLQAQKWILPTRGAVFYERDRTQAPAGVVGGMGEVEMPPILLEGELDRSKKYQELPPADLRDIPAWLAFDLRIKGRYKRTIHTVHGAAVIMIQGRASSMDSKGVQTIEATLTPDESKGAQRAAAATSISGTIKIARTIDRKVGLVRGFTSEFMVRVTTAETESERGPPGRGGRPGGRGRGAGRGATSSGKSSLTIKETWRLDRVEHNREPGFETRVREAIALGSDYVKAQLSAGGNLGRGVSPTGVDTDTGTLALCLLTLLKAGVDRRDDLVSKGFTELRARKLTDTYTLAVALMAMEALHAPTGEREMLIEGRIKEPLDREVPPKDFALMQEWAAQLLKNYDVSQQRAYMLRFTYLSDVPRYDNSNTQYALLGLYAAHLCKVPISPTVWFANAQHWLADQTEEKGVTMRFSTTSHRDYAKVLDQQRAALRDPESSVSQIGSRRTVSSSRAKASGWPYLKRSGMEARRGGRGGGLGRPGGMARPGRVMLNTASMTTAGLTGITICQAVLHGLKKGGKVLSSLRKAKSGGLGWMLHEFSVRANKNKGSHLHYYLYGLGRACEINQIALLGERDWYFEGANILVETQVKSVPDQNSGRAGRGRFRRGGGRFAASGAKGSFQGAGLPQTCMAILFLRQSAPPMPAITSGR